MKDVEKTNVDRPNSSKRLRRRKRNFNIYAVVVALLVVTAGVAISYTFLFNINEIKVSGESDMYTAEQIVDASGINQGDNLLRLDPEKSEQQILDKLLYVETATVSKDFPSSLEINVTRCVPAYNVNYDEGTLLVSKKGKILADNSFVTDGLPVVYGYEPSVTTAGKALDSSNQHKKEAFSELMTSLGNAEDIEVTSVDMSDEFGINVKYKNGIMFKMGNWSDVEYKLALADNIMNDSNVKGKKGYLTMVGTNQCSFRMTDEPARAAVEPATDKPQAVGPDGKPVRGENNPEQEKLFEEKNKEQQKDQQNQQGQQGQLPDNNGGYDQNNGYGGDQYGGYDPNNGYGGDQYGGYDQNNGYGGDQYGGYDPNNGYGGDQYGGYDPNNGYGGDQYGGYDPNNGYDGGAVQY